MNKNVKINSPRTLKACKTIGVLPDELYFINYNKYVSVHPEISYLPDDVKRYRFNLLEKIRLKTIEKIKKKRNEIIQNEKYNIMNESIIGYTPKKLIRNFEIHLPENSALNMTFTEKVSSMMKRENDSLNKLKLKQKQNIENMIEQQAKADMINYRYLEKEKRFKDNKERIKREIAEKEMRTQIIKEEKKKKQLTSIRELMNRKIIKINIKHDKSEQKRNILLEEKNKKREELIQKRTEELIKAYHHRSQLDLFKQQQEKIFYEKKLNNERRDRQILERLKKLKKIRKDINSKKHEKSAEIFRRNNERKEEQVSRFIKKVNLKHSTYFQRMKEYYKEMEEKSKIFKMHNTKKQTQHKNLFKSIEEARQKKIDDYFNDTMKKDQNVIICKLMKTHKILNRKTHENEMSDLVLEHKLEIEKRNKKKINDFENKMEELDNRIINFKKEEGHKILLKSQETFVKQAEKDIENKRNQRMKEYKNELKEKKIEEKEKMFDMLKNEKLRFRNKAKKLSFEIKNEKISLLDKFNKLLKKSLISCDMIKKFYPGDEELYERVKYIQKKYKMNFSTEKKEKEQNLTARNEHKRPKNILWIKNEEIIEKKVVQFRQKLRDAIRKDIEQERINESLRIKNYDEAKSIIDKKNIEQKNKLERNEFGKKITDLNDNLEKYVDDYRKKLIKENGY